MNDDFRGRLLKCFSESRSLQAICSKYAAETKNEEERNVFIMITCNVATLSKQLSILLKNE